MIDLTKVPIPNEHTERLTDKAREHDIYIQSGSMLEEDPKWPGAEQELDRRQRCVTPSASAPAAASTLD
jgi:hypothetical protein